MKTLFLSALILLCAATPARSGEEIPDEELPRLTAEDIPASVATTEVGDWARYSLPDGSTLLLTVVERWNEHNDDHLVIRSETTPRGRRRRGDTVASEDQVSVKERVADARDLGPEDFVTEAEILVDRRKLRAVVVNYVEDGKVARQSWFSEDVPVFGLVRGVRIEGAKKTVALNLKEFGSAGEGE